MITFSEYLSAYAAKRRISWQKASTLCGIDRTLLSRYASGKRLPENIDKVEKIARGLEMPPRQAKALKVLYNFSKAGSSQGKALVLIEQIFSNQNTCPFFVPPFSNMQINWRNSQVRRLIGQEEVSAAACWIIKTSSVLRLWTGDMAEEGKLISVLASADCRIEHIIQANYGEMAVEEFEKMLPFFLLGKEYQVYCYYQWLQENPSSGIGMQLMLGIQGMLLFSEDFSRGLFTNQAEYLAYYEKIYVDKLKDCRVFGGSVLKAQDEFFHRAEFLKNPYSGTIFICQNTPSEKIWVKIRENIPGTFFVEETAVVKMFKLYMECARLWEDAIEGGQEL